MTANNPTQNRKLEAAAEAVRKELGLETLQTRGRDALDFHSLSVASIRAAIEIAFNAGLDAAKTK